MNTTNYRADIDGLRAIAVISVLFFHVGFETFSGGYIGVDVFFVISGFLITRLIREEVLATDTFNFLNFYIRRIRRLFPALFLTLGASFVSAYFLFLPQYFERFGFSLVTAVFSISNLYFWRESRYFDVDSNFQPLLHIWSLSVEEQFYLIWPALLVLLLIKKPKLGAPFFLLFVGLTSFWLNLKFSPGASNPPVYLPSSLAERFGDGKSAIFYLTPFRIFEFAIGAITVWVVQFKPKNELVFEPMVVLGIAMILYPSLNYSEETLFPSYNALLPCFGTAVLMYSGTAKYTGLLLRNKISVRIGRISYSLYLVHWPIIIFYKYWKIDELSELEKSIILATSVTLAAFMYRFIEQPFRRGFHNMNAWHPSRFIATTLILALIIAAPSAHAWRNGGWNWRMEEVISQSSRTTEQNLRQTYSSFRAFCHIQDGFQGNCDFKRENRILILGDSFTVAWHFAFSEVFRKGDTEVFGLSYWECDDFKVTKTSVSSKITRNKCHKKAKFLTENQEFLSTLDGIVLSSHRPFSYKKNSYRFDLVNYISSFSPNVKLYVLGNYFQTDSKNPCELIVEREKSLNACFMPKYVRYVGTYKQAMSEPLFPKLDPESYTFIDVKNMLCGPIEECPYEANGLPFMLDWNHLTVSFAKYALETIRQKHQGYFKGLGIEK